MKSGENHKVMNRWYRKFFQYLDRYYVKYHSLPSLEDAGKSHFKKIVFENVKKEATNAIISLINSEREGDIVNKTLIR